MREAHAHGSFREYMRWLKHQPDSAYPLFRLPAQMERSVKAANRGQDRETREQATREAVRDVLFLFFLHQGLNRLIAEEERVNVMRSLYLITEQRHLNLVRHVNDDLRARRLVLERRLPYPLDPERAAAVEAAQRYHVTTWEELEAEEEPETVEQIRRLCESGEIAEGRCVDLVSVSVPFLQSVPLVEGEWLDAYVVELAEWGARVQEQDISAIDQVHALTPGIFVSNEIELEEVKRIVARARLSAQRSLGKFSGRTKDIEGRRCVRFEDYRRRRGRKLKGDLADRLCDGVVTASWNGWVESHAEGAKFEKLGTWLSGCPYQVVSNPIELERRLAERALVLDQFTDSLKMVRLMDEDKLSDRLAKARTRIKELLCDATVLARTAEAIDKRYFDGHVALWPDLADGLRGTFEMAESVAGMCDSDSDEDEPIGVDAIRISAEPVVNAKVRCLVDTAKAETLDLLGYRQNAVELMRRHV